MWMKLKLWAGRIVSIVAMTMVIGAEEFMHMLNIPHPEGWWLPLLGSGAVAHAISTWVQKKWKKKSGHVCSHDCDTKE